MSDITTFLAEWTNDERDGDTAALDTKLTDDFVGVGPLGFMLPKAAWLDRHHSGDLHYDTFELDEVVTRVHGDAAVTTARQSTTGNYKGNPIPESARATLSLVEESGGWRLAGVHMSFIAGTPGAPPLPARPLTTGDAR